MSSAAKAREMETNATSAMDAIVLIVLAGRRTAPSREFGNVSFMVHSASIVMGC